MLAGSWVFYAWWRLDFLVLLVAASVGGALLGRVIAATPNERRRGALLAAGVVVALGALAYFKYAAFIYETLLNAVHYLFQRPAAPFFAGRSTLEIVLPVGISFFTFQVISYLVDVYRGTAPAGRSVVDVAAYVSLFPQLVAGPIVRYSEIATQLVDRAHSWEQFAAGARRFMVGMARKVLIADAVAPLADAAFATVSGGASPGFAGAWLGLAAYTLQIYFDFAAYSDMAIGLGRMIGFEFPENFRQPYLSRSITEFWRRWHITLSAWLRDYLYVPLGGNRHGTRRTLVNLMVVMTLGGLWHGANWTFVLWGIWHGAWLVLERTVHHRPRFAALGRVVLPGITLLIVMVGWVLFRSPSVGSAVSYLSALAGGTPGPGGIDGVWIAPEILYRVSRGALAALSVGSVLVVIEPQVLVWLSRARTAPYIIATAFIVSVARLLAASFSPFLYFQF
jgi:alginate O-acetyltransferase complex protein AlgI